MIPNPLDSIQAVITDPAVRVAQMKAPLSSPPANTDFPYVVLWSNLPTAFSGGGHDDPNLADLPDALDATLRITYAATSGPSLYWLVNRVRPFLDRQAPIIDGFYVEKLRVRSLMSPEVDRDITLAGGLNPVYAIDEARIIAHKTKEANNGQLQ